LPRTRSIGLAGWRLHLAALALAGVSLAVADEPASCLDPAEYDKAIRIILCDCGCHPQSVHDCACGRAAQMRDEIRATMTERCLSADALVALYVEQHGQQIRIAPAASGFNLVAWLGPLFALVGASLAMIFVLRRWTRRPGAATPPPAPAPLAEGDPYAARLRQALEDMK